MTKYALALCACLLAVHCHGRDPIAGGERRSLGDGGPELSEVGVDRSGRTLQSTHERGTTTPRDPEGPKSTPPDETPPVPTPDEEQPAPAPTPDGPATAPDEPAPGKAAPEETPGVGEPEAPAAPTPDGPAPGETPEVVQPGTPTGPPTEPAPGTTPETPAQPEPGTATEPPGPQPPAVPAEPPVVLPPGFATAAGNQVGFGQPGYTIVHEPTGMEFVWVPAGEFEMGAYGGNPDAAPAHKVTIGRGMWLGKCEVTNAQYQLFCRATRVPFPTGSDAGPQHPVVLVSWPEAVQFAEHYGMRLPTEAEWEYAARGPAASPLPWGDCWNPDVVCAADNRGPDGRTFPVGSFPEGASWCGALDMAGNVFEWCSDWYHHRAYVGGDTTDPQGPPTGTYRVVRGGSFANPAPLCRSAIRSKYPPNYAMRHLGFRCVLSEPAPGAPRSGGLHSGRTAH